MHRLVISILIFILSAYPIISQSKPTDILFGSVKTVTESTYSVEVLFGEVNRGMILSKVIIYYDDMGNNSIRDTFIEGDLVSRWSYIYNVENIRIEGNAYTEDGSLVIKQIYYYDDNKKRTMLRYYDSFGKLMYYYTYTYYENGKLREWTTYNNNNQIISKQKYEYKVDGAVIEEITNPEGRTNNWIYVNDERGRRIQESLIELSSGGIIEEYKYKYEDDDNGNWILMIKYRGVYMFERTEYIPFEIVERVIEYI